MSDPLDAVYAYAEQAYIRMQAGDLLMRCMDIGSTRPMQELVESLVLAGPQSLGALSEILAETGQRRAQIQDDVQRLYGEFQNKLRPFGLRMQDFLPDAISLTRLKNRKFNSLLTKQGLAEDDRQRCLTMLEDTREMMKSLTANIILLQEIENYLWDWLWGLAHQSAHTPNALYRPDHTIYKL
jgi:hypothetical protein